MHAPFFVSLSSSLRIRAAQRNATFLVRTLLAGLLGVAAFAPAYADDPDPSARVARVSYLKGDVYIQPAEAGDWVQARINRPLTNNDQLWTDGDARAELQVGNSAIQLDENTQLSVLELSDNVVQLQLTQGTASVYVRGMDQDETIEIDTPNAATTVQEPGTYRVQVGDSGELTVVQVRSGSAEVAGERQSFSLRENEQVTLRGATRLAAEFNELGRMDDFDRWAAARNTRATHVIAAQYVSSDMIGYEDLDDYGYWRNEPDYGQVWIPTRVVANWSPYRFGHWDWIAPWGWTWVDDAPWGFAPFHYGRWAQVRDNWCWVPGPRAARAVYAPALVAWVGTPGVSVAVNVGTRPVGWVPLGPREIYRPGYRVSPRYIERVNLSNSLLKHDEFERGYRRQPHEDNFSNRAAATVVAANTLRSAQPVAGNLVRADVRKLQRVDATPNVRPDRAAMMGGSRVAPPPQIVTRDVVARRTPAQFAQPNNNTLAPRGAVRIVEPPAARRPFAGEQRGQAGQAIAPQPSPPPPANGQGPGRMFNRPGDRAQPNRPSTEPAEPVNALRPENTGRVLENSNEQPRGIRRGFVTPRATPAETPDASPAPSIQRAAPTPASEPASLPERRQPLPQVENNPRPVMRELPHPALRNRDAPATREEPPRQIQPRAIAPAPQRVEPAAPQQRAQPGPQVQPQPQPPPREQPAPQPNKQSNADEQERRRKQRERDAR